MCVFDLWVCVHWYVGYTHFRMKVKDEGQCQVSFIVLSLMYLFAWFQVRYLTVPGSQHMINQPQRLPGKQAPCSVSVFQAMTYAILPRQKYNASCFFSKYFTNISTSPDPLSSFSRVYICCRKWYSHSYLPCTLAIFKFLNQISDFLHFDWKDLQKLKS